MKRVKPAERRTERGQLLLHFGLILGFFLLAFVGLATDYTNFWYHRQSVQSAADATCQAGAMDLFLLAEGSPTAGMNFSPQKSGSIDCSTAPSAAPCIIAKYNGYDTALATNKVMLSFPATVPGINSPSWVGVPNIQVDITEQVDRYFTKLFSSDRVPVHASASCGLVAPPGPVPIIALHPTDPTTISMSGTQNAITVVGGPQTSIQVNSSNANGVNAGSLTLIDLTHAGPYKTGGDVAVYGGAATKPSSVRLGETGSWDYPIPPISDPYMSVAAPAKPTTNGSMSLVSYGQDGCPDVNGCSEFTPGYYHGGICVKGNGNCPQGGKATANGTAIFQPGVYYVDGNGLRLLSNSIARIACCGGAADGDGSGGAMFYFSGTGSLYVDANSGRPGLVDVYYRDGGTHNGVQSRALQCPGGIPNEPEIPATIDGNVLLGPCSGTYGDPSGQYRGFLYFQDRSAAAAPSWQGGGTTLAAGFMYFHQCRADGTGVKCSAPGPDSYGTTFNMGGNPGSGSYAVGSLVTDKIASSGNPGILMILNKNKYFPQLKVAF
jgi:putative Flp pilus-assembly TadE/G-like protein